MTDTGALTQHHREAWLAKVATVVILTTSTAGPSTPGLSLQAEMTFNHARARITSI